MEKTEFEKRFQRDERGCWNWSKCCGAGSEGARYGQFREKGKTTLAHRAAYEMYIGPIPDGLHVLHKCDNTKCVNPEHLMVGTNLDNIRDSVAKGRRKGIARARPSGLRYKYTEESRRAKREAHMKMRPQTRAEIAADCAVGMTQAAAASKYGVSQSTISRIVKEAA